MPFYNDLRPQADYDKKDFIRVFPAMQRAEKLRCIDGLLRLREALAAAIPTRRSEENLLVASWNLKEFGHTKQRLPESYYYIAEVISRFDLVAVQEIKSTLKDLSIVMRILGSDWAYLVNDITDGSSGNRERSCYIYNRNRVGLAGLVGELVLSLELGSGARISQIARTPYMTGFRAGWKSFVLINLHLSPNASGAKAEDRAAEVALLIKALAAKSDEMWGENLILTGDFNFYREADRQSIDLLAAAGFVEVDSLANLPTNAAGTESFDRFFIRRNKFFRLARRADGKDSGGIFNPYEQVFRLADADLYKADVLRTYTGGKDLASDPAAFMVQFDRYWQQNQLSDHLPIWFEIVIDSASPFLEDNRRKIAAEGTP